MAATEFAAEAVEVVVELDGDDMAWRRQSSTAMTEFVAAVVEVKAELDGYETAWRRWSSTATTEFAATSVEVAAEHHKHTMNIITTMPRLKKTRTTRTV